MEPSTYNDILLFLKKFLVWFLPSSLGVAAKLAYESRVKQLDKSHIITSIIMACFVGYICDSVCTKYDLITLRGVIVALGALASESFIQFFFKNDSNIIKGVIMRLFSINVDKPTGDNSASTNNSTTNTDNNNLPNQNTDGNGTTSNS